MDYTKAMKEIEKKMARKEKQLEELKAKLKERWPEDCYGVKWMGLYDDQSEKIKNEIKKLKDQRDIAWQYARMMETGSTDLDQ